MIALNASYLAAELSDYGLLKRRLVARDQPWTCTTIPSPEMARRDFRGPEDPLPGCRTTAATVPGKTLCERAEGPIGRSLRARCSRGDWYAPHGRLLPEFSVLPAAGALPLSECPVDSEPTPSYTNDRSELMRFIEREHVSLTGRVLEVGCAAGMAGHHLRRLGVTDLKGIELHTPAAAAAGTSGCYDVVHNCSSDAWVELAGRAADGYDAIIFADVLEHLPDPVPVLRRARALLRQPSGTLELSLPNIRHLSVFIGLSVRGDWEYHPTGIFDRTHLRFFTTKSARRLLTETGYSTVDQHRWGALTLSRAVAHVWPALGEVIPSQFFVVAAPSGPPRETP